MENTYNIIHVDFKGERIAQKYNLWQYDYNQILQISGLSLPATVEIHFSLTEKSGKAETRVATTENGITQVQIPNELLRNDGKSGNYSIFAFIYVVDEDSGNTEYEIILHVDSRPAPGEIGEDPDEPHLLDEAVNAVNAAADRAEQAEQNAKASAIEAEKYAASASESATAVEKNKKDALREVGEKKQEAIEAIQEQEETSVGEIVNHTDNEIKRIQNQTADSKAGLEQTITNADASKRELDHSIETAGTSKTALDKSTGLAGTAKTELDTSTQKAGEAKTALDGSAKTAGEMQETLSATVKQAGALDTSLGEKIKTGTQLKTELTASGEKAVQDIQAAGSEQLGKMQAVAEEFTADREQIATNKEDIGSLKEDIGNKITKFYASNQGETHLADSDNGKIMDMMLYGKSEQFTTTGKNLLKIRDSAQTTRGITVTGKDGVFSLKGTATETGWAVFDVDSFVLDGTCIVNSNISTGIKVVVANKAFKTVLEQNKPATLENAEVSKVCFTVTKGETYDMSNILIQIEKGSKATSYEPYTGGIPSPSPDYPQEIKSVVNPTVKVCGKNLLQSNLKFKDIEKINIQKGTRLTLICKNGVVSRGGNLRFKTADGGIEWFGFDANAVKAQTVLRNNVVSFEYLFNYEPSESYALYIGNENTYEPYKEQSVQFTYTLNAIPVSSGGNVTIDGQQYIADRVVEKDGIFGVERNTATDVPVLTKKLKETPDLKGRFMQDLAFEKTFTFNAPLVNIGYGTNWGAAGNVIDKWIFGVNNKALYISPPKNLNYTSEDIFNALKDLNIKVYGALLVPFFEPLPGDIQAKLRTLVANYPVTNITVTSDQLDEYIVFSYPISMANGWNYVKQQLGDTRDYIYDMDLQSAEAYVNSEYAVALTELEV